MKPSLAMHAAQTSLGIKGLRVTRLVNGERVECWKYRTTELAARQAIADVKWLNTRNPAADYQLEIGELEDEPTTEEKLVDARVAAGEYDIVESRE